MGMKGTLLGLFAIILLLGGCGGRQDADADADAEGHGRTALVGVLAPRHGSGAFKGEQGLLGLKQQLQLQPRLGDGTRIALKVEELQDEAAPGVAALERLAQLPDLVAVVSFLNSDAMLAVAPAAERLHLPVLLASATNPGLVEGRSFVSQVIFEDRLQAEVSALYARDELRLDRVAVFADPQSSYSRFLAAEFTSRFEAVGGVVVSTVQRGARGIDYPEELVRLRRLRPQLLYITLGAEEIEAIARELKTLDWSPRILVREGLLPQLAARLVTPRNLFDGIIGTDVYMEGLPLTEPGRQYLRAVREFGTHLDTYSVLGHESLLVLMAAMDRCAAASELDRECVGAGVRNTGTLQGMVGPIAIDGNGYAVRPVVVNTIKKGRLIYLVRVY